MALLLFTPLLSFNLIYSDRSHVALCYSWTALVAEIKEIKEKRQKEDDLLLIIAAGSRHAIIPNMEFEYMDPEVHEDVFRIIKYSCEEICSTKDQLNKVLRFWTTFLEPILGVHSRMHDSETAEDQGVSKHPTLKSSTTSLVESEGSPNGNATTTNLKLPKSNCNGNSSSSPERANVSRTDFMNAGTSTKEGVAVAIDERLTNSSIAGTSAPPDGNHGMLKGRAVKIICEDICSYIYLVSEKYHSLLWVFVYLA